MTSSPPLDWDTLLLSPMRLAPSVSLRFELSCGRCLHDERSGSSWSLEPWQAAFLREIDRGAVFPEVARSLAAAFPETATPEALRHLAEGMRRHGFLEIDPPLTPREMRFVRRGRQPVWTPAAPSAPGPGRAPPARRKQAALASFAVLAVAAVGWWASGIASASRIPAGEIRSAGRAELAHGSAAHEADRQAPVALVQGEATPGQVEVKAAGPGVLSGVMVRRGDWVKAGDALAVVDDPVARETRDDLRRLLGECRVRRDQFYESGALVEYLRESQAMAQLARELSEWEIRSDPAVLRAPVSGEVGLAVFPRSLGGLVEPGAVVLTIHPRQSQPEDGARLDLLATRR